MGENPAMPQFGRPAIIVTTQRVGVQPHFQGNTSAPLPQPPMAQCLRCYPRRKSASHWHASIASGLPPLAKLLPRPSCKRDRHHLLLTSSLPRQPDHGLDGKEAWAVSASRSCSVFSPMAVAGSTLPGTKWVTQAASPPLPGTSGASSWPVGPTKAFRWSGSEG